MDPIIEIDALERLWSEGCTSAEFLELHRRSKWGRLIAMQVIAPLKRNEPQAVEDAIVYLESNPWCSSTRHVKMRIAAILKTKTLSEEQRTRLRRVIVTAVASPKIGMEFKEYARLALVVADAEMLGKVAAGLQSDDARTRARCERILRLQARHGRSETAT